KTKGGHRFRSEPAPPSRHHSEKAIKAGPVFGRAGRWHRDCLPKRVLEQREHRHLRRRHYRRATLHFARQTRRRDRPPHVYQTDLERSPHRKTGHFARYAAHRGERQTKQCPPRPSLFRPDVAHRTTLRPQFGRLPFHSNGTNERRRLRSVPVALGEKVAYEVDQNTARRQRWMDGQAADGRGASWVSGASTAPHPVRHFSFGLNSSALSLVPSLVITPV